MKIHPQILNPDSIVVIGASNDVSKPGGKVVKNILDHNYQGKLITVNPKEDEVQGTQCYHTVEEIPEVGLAIIAIPAKFMEETVRILAEEKNCKGFIIFSAGFSETGEEGRKLEERCAEIVDSVGGTLIGPNCIGVITGNYKGVFAGPIPKYDPQGCDCVSASGATLVYLLEVAIPRGLKFRNIISVGNSAQVGVEDILEYWDETFDPETSSKIKLLYLEQIADPARFLKHARSLTQKGCRIAAIKAGSTEAGSRAVSSHTGALAGSNTAVNALFRKAGVVRCYSRVELVYMAGIFTFPKLKGDRMAIITHAGGPGVMLTDVLTRNGMEVPPLDEEKSEKLLTHLFAGSSVANPIDFLATGTAEQLGIILDYVENEFDNIDGAAVVFGTTGMWRVDDVYEVLHEKMANSKKPIFPILPSIIQAADEVSHFHEKGHVNFLDETSFGYVLSRVNRTKGPYDDPELPQINIEKIREIIDSNKDGYLSTDQAFDILELSGIDCAKQSVVTSREEVIDVIRNFGFPLVMKVEGPVHKSDVGGVILNVNTEEEALGNFENLMKIEDAVGVLIQQQISGNEILMGASKEDNFGHQILVGLGGIFVEVFKDVVSGLVPIGKEEAQSMIRHLKSYPIIQGVRGKEGVNEDLLKEYILRLSALLKAAPEIMEMDINPLMGNMKRLTAVDVRIRIEK